LSGIYAKSGGPTPAGEIPSMWDLLALVLTIVFFAVALWYVQGCEKLR
jgi:hypothetical protein